MKLSNAIKCHQETESNYEKLLASISNEKKTIINISKDIGLPSDNTQRMIKKLQKNGYVKKAFAGKRGKGLVERDNIIKDDLSSQKDNS